MNNFTVLSMVILICPILMLFFLSSFLTYNVLEFISELRSGRAATYRLSKEEAYLQHYMG